MPATSRPLILWGSILTIDWDHSQSTVRLVTVRTGSAFLHQWVDFIPSSMWSNCLWLLWTPFLANGHLRLLYRKLWMVKESGWWRRSWIVGWSTRNFVTSSNGKCYNFDRFRLYSHDQSQSVSDNAQAYVQGASWAHEYTGRHPVSTGLRMDKPIKQYRY